MTEQQTSPFLTPKEAAELMRCHPRTAMRLCERGVIKAVKVGTLWRINRASLMAFLGVDDK